MRVGAVERGFGSSIALVALVLGAAPAPLRAESAFATVTPAMMKCDVDGDGIQDLIGVGTSTIRVQRFDGSVAVALPPTIWTGGGAYTFAGCADLDGEGRDDLVFDSPYTWSRLNYWLDPTSLVTAQSFVRNGGGTYPVRSVADIDGDGIGELIRGRDGSSYLRIDSHAFPSVGYGPPTVTSRWIGTDGGSFRFAAVGDVDGDGRADVALESAGMVRIDRAGGALLPLYFPIDDAERVVALGDTNGDGRADLITAGRGFTRIRTLDGATVLATGDVSDGGGAYPTRLVADANGDAKADLIGASDSGAFVRVALLDGVASPSRSYVGTGAGAFALRQAGDFSGDGKADLLQEGLGWIRVVKLDPQLASPEIVWVSSSPQWALLDFRAPLP